METFDSGVGQLIGGVASDDDDDADAKSPVEGGEAGVLLCSVADGLDDDGGRFCPGHRLYTAAVDARANADRTSQGGADRSKDLLTSGHRFAALVL